MVAAWPFICSPRSAELCSISLRRSGLASNTTPLPKIGAMNGYAAAWSKSSSAERKKNSLAPAPESRMTCLSTSWNQPTSPHSSRTRFIKPIGSVRNSSRWPCSSSPPETRGTIAVVMCSLFPAECEFLTIFVVGQRGFGLKLHVRDEAPARCLGDERDCPPQIRRAQEVVVPGLAPLGPVLQCGADLLGRQAP